MKIKEVIEKTGLTDRAIRLYIDEGLIAPSIGESYSGRKSIEFSQEDVERLKNVAMLRKAGFTIADIKSIVDDESTIKSIVEKFIEQTEENIAHETEIVEKLKGISFDTEVTLETVCESLSATVEEKEVPKEDIRVSLWSIIERNSFKAFGVTGLLITVAVYVLLPLYWAREYTHLTLVDDWISKVALLCSGWIAVDVLCVFIILLNRNKSVKRKKKSRRVLSYCVVTSAFAVGCFSALISLCGIIAPPAYSMTTDIKDYMMLDSWVERGYGEEIRNLFPEEIPTVATETTDKLYTDSPFTTRYFYKYSCDFDQLVDIVAEWVLPTKEFEEAKSEAYNKAEKEVPKGDWICLYYPSASDDYFIFAYNENERKVRYIASTAIGVRPGYPYYEMLDW